MSNVLRLNSHSDLAVEQIKADGDYVAAFAAAFGDDAITVRRLGPGHRRLRAHADLPGQPVR